MLRKKFEKIIIYQKFKFNESIYIKINDTSAVLIPDMTISGFCGGTYVIPLKKDFFGTLEDGEIFKIGENKFIKIPPKYGANAISDKGEFHYIYDSDLINR